MAIRWMKPLIILITQRLWGSLVEAVVINALLFNLKFLVLPVGVHRRRGGQYARRLVIALPPLLCLKGSPSTTTRGGGWGSNQHMVFFVLELCYADSS